MKEGAHLNLLLLYMLWKTFIMILFLKPYGILFSENYNKLFRKALDKRTKVQIEGILYYRLSLESYWNYRE